MPLFVGTIEPDSGSRRNTADTHKGGGGWMKLFPNLFRKENELPRFVSNIFQTNSALNIIDTYSEYI